MMLTRCIKGPKRSGVNRSVLYIQKRAQAHSIQDTVYGIRSTHYALRAYALHTYKVSMVSGREVVKHVSSAFCTLSHATLGRCASSLVERTGTQCITTNRNS